MSVAERSEDSDGNGGRASAAISRSQRVDGPKKVRVAVLNSHPIQYFAPLYRYLQQSGDFEVTALYCSDFSLRDAVDPGFAKKVAWDVDLLSGYEVHFLGSRASRRTPRGFWSLVCPELWAELRRGRYDALIVHGNQFFAYVLAVAIAKLHGIAVLNRCDTHLGLSRPRFRRWLRGRVLSVYYRLFDGFLAIGTANRRYYEALGVPPARIFSVPFSVDNERFIRHSRLSAAERLEVRRAAGMPETIPVILFASKFTRRKNPDILLRAAAILAAEGLCFHILFVGGGEMEEELRLLAGSLGLENVTFGGFVNQAVLPRLYAATDVFVLPAHDEPWGLVVNEVMCAGRPVVITAGVGCVQDLVRHRVNGMVMQDVSPESLADALRPLLEDPQTRSTMGAESERIIRSWDFESCRRGLREAMTRILTSRSLVPTQETQ